MSLCSSTFPCPSLKMDSSSKNPRKDEVEEEDVLSLRDLPTSRECHGQFRQAGIDHHHHQEEEEFKFLQFSKDSKMCAADEVFFQGQILPKVFTGDTASRCFSRSESNQSTDHFTSRSSSINSHRSSSSGSSSSFSTNAAVRPPSRRHPKSHNQFQFSHPSPKPKPKPKPHFQNFKTSSKNRNSPSPSTIWSFLRVGLVAPPPEIAMQDLKLRTSRNSTSSNVKQGSSKLSGKNRVLFNLGGCNCTADAVVGPVPSPLNTITRNPSAKEEAEEDNSVELRKTCNDDDDKNRATRKQSASRHRRTFEWLKQLSLEETPTVVVIDDQ